jgi:hypothetical protein
MAAISKTLKTTLDGIAMFVDKRVRPMEKRIAALEARLAQQRYVGTWSQGAEYKSGNSISHGGCVWVALEDTSAKPGTANNGWVLAVKKGRDGKDAK